MHEFFEDPFQVGEGVMTFSAHLFDKGVDDGTAPAGFLASNKHPILCSQLRGADGVLDVVVIQFDPAVLKAGFKVWPLSNGVLQCFSQGTLGKEATAAHEMMEKFLVVGEKKSILDLKTTHNLLW